MWIKQAEFLKSSSEYQACPEPDKPEFALAGRSNVGKSSFINRLCNKAKLARISSVPGKTETINHYLINERLYLVDLPGYGFAKTSKLNREKWSRMIYNYLTKRKNLVLVLLLVDVRIPAQESDRQMIERLNATGIPVLVIFTKSDKMSNNVLAKNSNMLAEALGKTLDGDVWYLQASSHTGLGIDETAELILKMTEQWYDKRK